jgi:hypothetical protein
MSHLSLSNQCTISNQVQQRINALRTEMEKRREIWFRLPYEKKRLWVKSGKDPIMSLAWTIYKYLREWFQDAPDGEE